MRILFQIAVLLITLLIGALIIRNSKVIPTHKKRKAALFVAGLAIILGLLAGYVPIESYLYTFPSLKTALEQTASTNLSDEDLVVEGEGSAMVFLASEDPNSLELVVYYKDDSGWKMAGVADSTLKEQGILLEGHATYSLYYCSQTSEYYLLITDLSEKGLEIKDSLQSNFVEYNNRYIAYLGHTLKEYSVTINGVSFSIPEL